MPLIANVKEGKKRSDLSSRVLTSEVGSRTSGCPEHSLHTFVAVEKRDVLLKARACQAMKEDVKMHYETCCACFIRRVVRKKGSSRLGVGWIS